MAVLPLGTGHDLALSFGWGTAFLPSWLRSFASVYHLLRRVADGQPRELDCWKISMRAADSCLFKDLPYSLQQSEDAAEVRASRPLPLAARSRAGAGRCPWAPVAD